MKSQNHLSPNPPSWFYDLFFLPPLFHAAAVILSTWDLRRYIDFGKIDAAVFLFWAGYIFTGALLMERRRRMENFIILSYAVFLAFALCETVLAFTPYGHSRGLPRLATKRVSKPSGLLPGVHGITRFTINAMGLRSPSIWPADRRDRILCVGGSTTECLYVSDEKTWPWRLSLNLTSRLGRPILAGNAGLSGQISLHHAYQLENYRYAKQFGRVLVMCGINELGMALRRSYQDRARWVPREALLNWAGRGAYYRSSSVFSLITFGLDRKGPQSEQVIQDSDGIWLMEQRRMRRELLERKVIKSIPPGHEKELAQFKAVLERIVAVCRDRNQTVTFLTQPSLYAENLSSYLQGLLIEHTADAAFDPGVLQKWLEKYNQVVREVSRESGVDCVELAAAIPKDTTAFYDDCHFNDSGCKKVAEILTAYYLTKLE